MSRPTVLDLTQEILSGLSSDEVNSIGDTTESLQVATILKRCFKNIVARSNIPEHGQLIQLVPSNDSNIPVLMTVPEEVRTVEWIKYFNTSVENNNTYQYVTILPIQQFIDMINMFDIDEDEVNTFIFTDDSSGLVTSFNFNYKNNRQPTYCTIISNKFIIFDSYDNEIDDTLQASKSMAYGKVSPVFRLEDSFVTELNEQQFALLLNEAKALAFVELKQIQHPKAEQEIQRQWSTLQSNKYVNDIPTAFDRLPNYGRQSYGRRR